MTPHQRASTHVVAAWEGCYSQMFGSAVASEERALLAETEVARLREALRKITDGSVGAHEIDWESHWIAIRLCAVNALNPDGAGHPECPCSDFTVEDPGPHIAGCLYADESYEPIARAAPTTGEDHV